MVDEEVVQLDIWDTAGQADYDRLRPLSYPQTDVFLVCFDISNEVSFQHVKNKWFPEVRLHSPGTPVVLCGTKADLRDSKAAQSGDRKFTSKKESDRLARDLGAAEFLECSALYQQNVKEVFDACLRHATNMIKENEARW
eukprot:TRINITY_DN12091_c0_g1_i1.p1 TRINITY_DN12091_c0_g1~~TRINITY_DN12091_c0_g1_i1.p1  ORF type:complete len:140 (-),score=18.02 TRINITY_DN12091_c0_g1_i1:31-450(-)